MNHAILDLDGTLLPGVLGTQYLNDLIEDGACDRDEAMACLRAIDRYAAMEEPRASVMAEAYRCYAAALRGIPYAEAQVTAARTWKTCRRRLFPFADDLIDLLKAHDYRIHLISGNADMPIQEAVGDLALSWGRGALTEVVDGRFTERLTCAPGLPGGKDSVIRELTASDEFARRRAIAIGNADSDAEIFAHVDMAIAFDPGAELRALSARHGWHVVDRDTILPTCARLLDGRH
ncbi:haloacid dehalogenase-like hydrolase [Streptomyces sp. TRM 70361]|uniref:HAD family hydrolase n=1 Tax=Streptomyces sp. TRM 70361 TaxID=3116553 RepID=UPI002E7BF57E|nr:haloacid dehalogenase-like hydrolase [Streptomyces sp. TRM 70361]MEE1939105.1 haloacid dehalogenase-like hydrolase [Streptomyces sp. TRM 70361]